MIGSPASARFDVRANGLPGVVPDDVDDALADAELRVDVEGVGVRVVDEAVARLAIAVDDAHGGGVGDEREPARRGAQLRLRLVARSPRRC
jgi:hypothetical protein